MIKTGIIILAAGNSSRLGTPKQLLAFEGKTLLKRIADEASHNPAHRVTAVLGAYHETVEKELAGSKVAVTVNARWMEGMSGSIISGLHALLEADPDLGQCIITVCDQPFIHAAIFEELKATAAATGKGIIATGYAGTRGVPVLFSKSYFDGLFALDGREGAKKVIQKHMDDMAVFPFEPARFDIDTKADYYRLSNIQMSKP